MVKMTVPTSAVPTSVPTFLCGGDQYISRHVAVGVGTKRSGLKSSIIPELVPTVPTFPTKSIESLENGQRWGSLQRLPYYWARDECRSVSARVARAGAHVSRSRARVWVRS